MAERNLFLKIGNPLMRWLTRSPLHGLISNSVMLVTVTGRKSGKKYSTPVNYQQQGNRLVTISQRQRTWWRNLRGGAPVSLRLRGREIPAQGAVIEDPKLVRQEVDVILLRSPGMARYLGISLEVNGSPDPRDLSRAARQRVIVVFTLDEGDV